MEIAIEEEKGKIRSIVPRARKRLQGEKKKRDVRLLTHRRKRVSSVNLSLEEDGKPAFLCGNGIYRQA